MILTATFLLSIFLSAPSFANDQLDQGGHNVISGPVDGLLYGITQIGSSNTSKEKDRNSTITGRCFMTSKQIELPCPTLKLKLQDRDQKVIQTTWVDAQGVFRFSNIKDGEYTVAIENSDYQIANQIKFRPGTSVLLEISEGMK